MADLDLETGDPARADEDTPAGRRRRRRASGETAGTGARAKQAAEGEIRAGLSRAFNGLAENRYAHDDQELGNALTEEADAMTDGIVTLTDGVPFLRNPIVIALHVIITMLAFGRVFGILIGRAQDRRLARQQAAAEEQGGVPITEVQ